MSLLALYVTCPDAATARQIAADLVARRLAACVHLLAPIESTYRWEGRVETATETPLLAKTRPELFAPAAAAVRALHPYRTPAIVAFDLPHVAEDYLAWARAETVAG